MPRIRVTVDLQNNAAAGGNYVVQVYFTPPISPSRLTRYRHSLGGFTKVRIGPNAKATATVDVLARDLAHWDPKRPGGASHVVDAGDYQLFVCHSARGLAGDAQAGAEGLPSETQGCLSLGVTLR